MHESIRKPFVETFAASARGLRMGHGAEEGTDMGPMANARGVARADILSEGYWRPRRIGGHDHVDD